MGFGGFPQCHQFLLRIFGKGLVRQSFHFAEGVRVFVAGPMEGILRIGAGHLADLGGGKEGVPQLFPDAVGSVHVPLGFQCLPQLPGPPPPAW